MLFKLEYTTEDQDLKKIANNVFKYSKLENIKKAIWVFGVLIIAFLFYSKLPLIYTLLRWIFIILILFPVYKFMFTKGMERKLSHIKHLHLGDRISIISENGFSTKRVKEDFLTNERQEYNKKHNLKSSYNWNEVLYFSREEDLFILYLPKNNIAYFKGNSQSDKVESFLKDIPLLKKG
ncbi:hypothetical protein [Pseudogracilibacillus auburnensis]|uniref:hypothetical protein n=1 Tax=Pseudogracilibacillus auburnensis TaxID=1494959 RepID=UPI001A97C103|nr:hypothetical protein [Pseudogracilibacillus auburnensis]MBO1003304.1 hypothetical protein [Pseudogracilibacillus auburnensis]